MIPVCATIWARKLPAEEVRHGPCPSATLLSSRESRNGVNDELLTIVEPDVLGWSGVRKKSGIYDLEQQTNLTNARIAARLAD
jgi:hypothetical protein